MEQPLDTFRSSTSGWLRGSLAGWATLLLCLVGIGLIVVLVKWIENVSTTYELTRVAPEGDAGLLDLAGEALRQVRRAKSDRKLSMKAEVPLAEALGPADVVDRLQLIEGDLRSAGRISKLDYLPGRTTELVIASAF